MYVAPCTAALFAASDGAHSSVTLVPAQGLHSTITCKPVGERYSRLSRGPSSATASTNFGDSGGDDVGPRMDGLCCCCCCLAGVFLGLLLLLA